MQQLNDGCYKSQIEWMRCFQTLCSRGTFAVTGGCFWSQSGCVVFSDVVFKRYVCSDWLMFLVTEWMCCVFRRVFKRYVCSDRWWMFLVIEMDVFSDVCSSGTHMQCLVLDVSTHRMDV